MNNPLKHDLTEKNYFSQENSMKYVGSSQIKDFIKCEACALAKIKGEWKEKKSKALLIGSYIDAAIEGTLEQFKEENPEIFKVNGELKADYSHANYMIERMKKDDFFMKYLNGEKQIIMTGKIVDVPVKIKIDAYHVGKCIVDLKSVKDFEKIWNENTKVKENFVDYWGYDLQGALYREIVRQNTGEVLPFMIAAITKEVEPDLAVLAILEEDLENKLYEIQELLPRMQMIKSGTVEPSRCGKCDYCKSTKKLNKVIYYKDI